MKTVTQMGGYVDLRAVAVEYMRAMAKVEWTAGPRIDYSFNNKTLIYEPGQKYVGMIYNNCRNVLENFEEALDENGVYKLEDTGWNTAPGNSCATSIKHAWQLISPTVEYQYSVDMMPPYPETGVKAVGGIDWSRYDGKNTTNSVLNENPMQTVLEAYAAALPGDAFMRYLDTGGHALMVTLPATVVRTEDGSIDPEQSFAYLTDQNCVINHFRDLPSSWKVDRQVSFAKCYADGWLPVTVQELIDGKAPAPEFSLSKQIFDPGKGFCGRIRSNYALMNVLLTLNGTEYLLHPYTKAFRLSAFGKLVTPKKGDRIVLTAEVGLGSCVLADKTL